MVEVSAKQGTNLKLLLEMILLVADLQDLKANPEPIAAWLDGVTTVTGEPGLPAVRKALKLN